MNDAQAQSDSAEGAKTPLTRDAIIEAAKELVTSMGLDQLSLRRLATRLGVTAPALYAHVDDKSDLLRAIATLGFEQLVAAYQEIDESDPVERLRATSTLYIRHALAEPELFRLMFLFRPSTIRSTGDPDDLHELTVATTAFESPYRAVQEAIEAGRFHPDRDPLVTAIALWTATHGVAVVLLMGIDLDDTGRRALERSVIDSMLSGLALPPTAG